MLGQGRVVGGWSLQVGWSGLGSGQVVDQCEAVSHGSGLGSRS